MKIAKEQSRWLGAIWFSFAGKFDPKAASFSWLRFHADFSAHAFNDFVNNGEADSCPVMIVRQALEHAKEPGLSVFAYADSVVFDPNTNELCR